MSVPLYNLRGNVKALLKERGMTQGKLAKRWGFNESTVSSLLNNHGGTYWYRIKKLARILGVAPEEISELSGKTAGKPRLYSVGHWEHKTHYEAGKPCGVKRILEIIEDGVGEYLLPHEKRRMGL